MADEFPETGHSKPQLKLTSTRHYGSQYSGRGGHGDKKIRTKIVKVRKEEVKDRETGKTRKKARRVFRKRRKASDPERDKQEVRWSLLSGKTPAGWLDATVGILVDPNVMFGGKTERRSASARAPSSCGGQAGTEAGTAAERPNRRLRPLPTNGPDEKGDPGADPSMADFEPAE